MQISPEDKQALNQAKKFFTDYKKWLIAIILLVILPLLGYQFYQNIKEQEKIVASNQFINLVQMIETKQFTDALQIVENLEQENLLKPYAKQNLFLQAEVFYNNNQIDQAVETLQTIINAERDNDSVFYHLANIQLVRLLIEKEQYLEAEDRINALSETKENYQTIYTYYQALIHKSLGRNQRAREAFSSLIELTSNDRAFRELARAELNLIAN